MIINGWYCCPICKKKLFRITDKGIEVKCTGKIGGFSLCRSFVTIDLKEVSDYINKINE